MTMASRSSRIFLSSRSMRAIRPSSSNRVMMTAMRILTSNQASHPSPPTMEASIMPAATSARSHIAATTTWKHSFSTMPVFADSDDDEDADRTPIAMSDLVHEVRYAVNFRKRHDIAPGSSNDPILQLFRSTLFSRDQWLPYAHFSPKDDLYTRNLIATDHDKFSLLLLCWNPHAASPIHDHPCDGCWMSILSGSVREKRYDSDLRKIADDTYQTGEIAYITDQMGYHKVECGSPETPAVSLHLYAPPITSCRTWQAVQQPQATPEPTVCHATNHSEYGRVV